MSYMHIYHVPVSVFPVLLQLLHGSLSMPCVAANKNKSINWPGCSAGSLVPRRVLWEEIKSGNGTIQQAAVPAPVQCKHSSKQISILDSLVWLFTLSLVSKPIARWKQTAMQVFPWVDCLVKCTETLICSFPGNRGSVTSALLLTLEIVVCLVHVRVDSA